MRCAARLRPFLLGCLHAQPAATRTPFAAPFRQRINNGSLWTIGVKGSFCECNLTMPFSSSRVLVGQLACERGLGARKRAGLPILIWAALLAPALFAQSDPAKKVPAKKAPAQKTALPPALLAGLESHQGLTYARYGARELQLDLHRPAVRGAPLPAIVCIHGGGWFKGERGNMTQLAQALAARGYVAVTISYRLSGEAKFPAAIQDAKAAVRWLRANAATYGIDPDAIGVTGQSAGGHLAALLATSGGITTLEGEGGHAAHASAVQAAVAMGAQSDFETPRIRDLSDKPDDPHYRTFLGGSQQEIPTTYALGSPRRHLDRTDPPLGFVTGELDDSSTRADATRRDLQKLGIATVLTVIPQAPHAFFGQQRAFDIAVNACDAFFTLHLKHRSRPPVESTLASSPFASGAHWTMLGGGYAGSEGAQWIGDTLKVKGLDGLAFDSAGRLWCAALDGVHVFDPAGRDLGVIALPSKPTAIAFSPASPHLVCVTTRDAAFVAVLR